MELRTRDVVSSRTHNRVFLLSCIKSCMTVMILNSSMRVLLGSGQTLSLPPRAGTVPRGKAPELLGI